jgi:hypothetical protein
MSSPNVGIFPFSDTLSRYQTFGRLLSLWFSVSRDSGPQSIKVIDIPISNHAPCSFEHSKAAHNAQFGTPQQIPVSTLTSINTPPPRLALPHKSQPRLILWHIVEFQPPKRQLLPRNILVQRQPPQRLAMEEINEPRVARAGQDRRERFVVADAVALVCVACCEIG